MELFKLHAPHTAEVWVNPTQIVSVRLEFYTFPREPERVLRVTSVSLTDDTQHVDTREPERFLEDLRLAGLVPLR
jgi:hypothetical protein